MPLEKSTASPPKWHSKGVVSPHNKGKGRVLRHSPFFFVFIHVFVGVSECLSIPYANQNVTNCMGMLVCIHKRESISQGKVIMENDDTVELAQAEKLFLLACAMNDFHRLCKAALFKLFIRLCEDDEFLFENAKSALEHFYNNFQPVIALQEQDDIPKKSTYYEMFFVILEKVVPAVKGVESVFGDEVKYMGETFSEALQDFAQKA